MRDYKDVELWQDITPQQWNDWHWQVSNRITDIKNLKTLVNLTDEEEKGIKTCLERLRMAITPYYALLMDPDNPDCPIRALSHGINLLFYRNGYHFSGRLINNCNIMGRYEDMNLWVKTFLSH